MSLSKRKMKKAKKKYIDGCPLTRKEAFELSDAKGFKRFPYGMKKFNENIKIIPMREKVLMMKYGREYWKYL